MSTAALFPKFARSRVFVFVVSVDALVRLPRSVYFGVNNVSRQKHLLRDVFKARCDTHPLFGPPASISTVDKYQGQQNDIVLLSLVRTKHVGHLRDVRRLVVSLSRARLGVYVFGRERRFSKTWTS